MSDGSVWMERHMSEQDVIAASGNEMATEQSLATDLRTLGVDEGMVVLVHSSLSAIGWVCGGPVAVIRALLQAVGTTGTIVMPAHSTALSDPAGWENPPVPSAWRETIRATMPAFDAAVTPTTFIGVIPELFRTWPGAVRSNHPSCSFAALGRYAAPIVAAQRLEDPMGEGSPLSAVHDRGGHVLLLGVGRKVGHRNNTMLHLAERRALGDDQEKKPSGAPVLVDGVRRWVSYREPDIDEDDFDEAGAAFERQDTTTRTGLAGQARCTLLSAQALVDFAIPWFAHHRGGD